MRKLTAQRVAKAHELNSDNSERLSGSNEAYVRQSSIAGEASEHQIARALTTGHHRKHTNFFANQGGTTHRRCF